jgi:hypothetical protein
MLADKFDPPSIRCIQALEFSGAKPPPPPTSVRPHSAPLSAGRLHHAAEADDDNDDDDNDDGADVDRRGTAERRQLRAGAAAAGRLLRTLSEGYRLLSVYQCREAVDVLRTLPAGQYNTGCASGTDASHTCAGFKVWYPACPYPTARWFAVLAQEFPVPVVLHDLTCCDFDLKPVNPPSNRLTLREGGGYRC